MKKKYLFFLILPLIICCEGQNINNNNPYIPIYPVNLQFNLSLPLYSNIQFPSSHFVDYSQGARGIVVFNTGTGYNAFDLACPNQPFTSCGDPMTIIGVEAKCTCENTLYSLFSGQSQGQQYPMKQYRTQLNENTLLVFN